MGRRILKRIKTIKISVKWQNNRNTPYIPGLKAKPIIDILIVLKNFDYIDDITNILEPYGYENRGKQGIDDRFFFAECPDDAGTHYIHFTLPNSDTYYNQIYFKKYLIEHPEYIQKYCDLKEKLAKQYASNRPKYTKVSL